MINTPASHSRRRTTLGERVFVIVGAGLALAATAASLGVGVGIRFIGPLWMAALAWTAAASLTGAL